MKRYTSFLLKAVAVFYMAFPVLYLLLAAVVFDIPGKQCIGILLSPLYYLLGLLAVLSGYGLYEMKKWGWYVFLISNFIIVYSNAVLASSGESNHKIIAFIGSVVFIVLLTYRIGREVRVPYFIPRIRWWESNPHYRLAVPAKVERQARSCDGEILDLSMAGCFVKMREDFPLHEPVTVKFTLLGHTLRCSGVIVNHLPSSVTNPKGIGVKFDSFPKLQRKILRGITQRLSEINRLYRTSRYLLSPEEFNRRFNQLQTQPVHVSGGGEGKTKGEVV